MVDALRIVLPACFIALVVGVVLDWIGYLAYWPALYSIGLRVYREELPSLPRPLAPVGSFVDTTKGRFKVVEDGVVLMRHRWSLQTHDFTGRGTIKWTQGVAVAEARTAPWVPVFIVLGVGLFILGVVSGTWQAMVFGPAMSLAYGLIHVPVARKALRKLLAEYEGWAKGEPSSA